MPVHRFIDQRLTELKSDLSMASIAKQVGFNSHVMLSMIRHNKVRLPINKVYPLARAIGVKELELLEMVLNEYNPELWDTLGPVLKNAPRSENEMALMNLIRESAEGEDVFPTNAKEMKQFTDCVKQWKKSAASGATSAH